MLANTEKKQDKVLNRIKSECPWNVYKIGDVTFAVRLDSMKFLEGKGVQGSLELRFEDWKLYCFRILSGSRNDSLFSILSLLNKTNRKYCKNLGVYPSLLDIPAEFNTPAKQQKIKNQNCYSNFIQF
ncbi:hypothetical protein RJO76_002855 [Aeromonas veronii]|nr:hypothetical protein [Aeromonas veronii]